MIIFHKADGKKPLGYYYLNKELLINKQEKIVIQDIFDTFLDTESLTQTTIKINQKYKNRQNKDFSKQAINYVLQNVFYIGKAKCKKKIYKGSQKAIIDLKVFKKAQKLFNRKKRYKLNTIKDIISELKVNGKNQTDIAKYLNQKGIKNSCGKAFNYYSIHYLITKYNL